MNPAVNKNDLRNFLSSLLKEDQAVRVTFTKSDGTEREMLCTLREDVIQSTEKKTDRTKKENLDVMSVWDVEKNAWRSFRLDSVKQIGFEIGSNA